MHILIATDAFPPVAGGSGWSTYELARALRSRGHTLVIVQPYSSRPPAGFDGFEVIGFPVPAPRMPFVRNYVRNERLYPRLADFLAGLVRDRRIDLVHAQHELTGPAAVLAARQTHVPSVCTIRDYWPICYWSDLMRDPAASDVCPQCSAAAMLRCVRPRAGRAWPVAAPAIPYMRSNLRRKQALLNDADAVVAVSTRVAQYLRERSAIEPSKIVVIPNGVDIARVRGLVKETSRPAVGPYALFVGKLAPNKGVSHLNEAIGAGLGMPLVVIGDGPERANLIQLAAEAKRDVRVLEWLPRDDVFRWLGHAAMLIFPSNWPEPLSRVLIEAAALGIPVAAIDTGGTPEIVLHERTGLLSKSAAGLSVDVARLAADPALRDRLGAGAAKHAEEHFEISTIVARVERLYDDLLGNQRGTPSPTAKRTSSASVG